MDVDLYFNDCKVDIVEEGFDVVLWIGYLKNLLLIVKCLININLVMCVVLEYLVRYGELKIMEDLIGYNYLCYSLLDNDNSLVVY